MVFGMQFTAAGIKHGSEHRFHYCETLHNKVISPQSVSQVEGGVMRPQLDKNRVRKKKKFACINC